MAKFRLVDVPMGEKIRRIRDFRGMTCDDLAARVQITRSYMSQLENGKHKITRKMALKIATALEVSLEDLVDRVPTLNFEAREVEQPPIPLDLGEVEKKIENTP